MSAPPEATGIGASRFSRQSDERLLAASSRGDETSFDELHRRYRPALYGYCLLHLRDHQAAEDAVQEVFLRAASATSSTVSKPKSWLYTLARNVVIDATRKRKTQARPVDSAAMENEAPVTCEDALLMGESTGTIFLALRRLPVRQRRALVLREFHDMSSADIARELDTTPANVDVLVSRARSAFTEAYSAMLDLPAPCRNATEIIYRELGSGVSATKANAMHVHLASCNRCMAEYRRAHTPRYLQGLAFICPGASIAVERASQAASQAAHAIRTGVASISGLSPDLPVAARAGVGIALAAAALSPVALQQATFTHTDFQPHLTSTALAVAAPKSADSELAGCDGRVGNDVGMASGGFHETNGCAELMDTRPLRECDAPSTEVATRHSLGSEHSSSGGDSGEHTAESSSPDGHAGAPNDADVRHATNN